MQHSHYDSLHWNNASESVLAEHFPFHRACRDGDLATLEILIHSAPDGSIQRAILTEDTFYGWTAVHYAAYFGKLACLRKLLTLNVFINPDIETTRFRQTPCHSAAFGGNIDCLKWLIDSHASVSAKDYLGETSAHKATRSGSIECLSLLIANGAFLNCPNNAGQTPLDVAELCNQLECANYLRQQSQMIYDKSCSSFGGCKIFEDGMTMGVPISFSPFFNENSSMLVDNCVATIGAYGFQPSLTARNLDGPIVPDVMLDEGISTNKVPLAGRKRARNDGEIEHCNGNKRLKSSAHPWTNGFVDHDTADECIPIQSQKSLMKTFGCSY